MAGAAARFSCEHALPELLSEAGSVERLEAVRQLVESMRNLRQPSIRPERHASHACIRTR